MKKQKRKLTILMVCILILGFTETTTKQELNSSFLKKEFKEIEQYLTYANQQNIEVSKVSFAWHLDHILLVIDRIYQQMDTSDVSQYRNRFNFSRTSVFTLNKITRGRAESPKIVRPEENVSLDSIKIHLESAKKRAILFDSLHKKSHFEHPYLGKLNRRQAKKFIKIHTNHHLNIIRDIIQEY